MLNTKFSETFGGLGKSAYLCSMNARKKNDGKEIRLSREAKRKVYIKTSDFFLDLAKLVFGGVILTGIMGLDVNKALLFVVGGVVTALLAFFGYTFLIRGIRKN